MGDLSLLRCKKAVGNISEGDYAYRIASKHMMGGEEYARLQVCGSNAKIWLSQRSLEEHFDAVDGTLDVRPAFFGKKIGFVTFDEAQ